MPKSKQQTKRKATPKKKPVSLSVPKQKIPPHLTHTVCGLTDPFCNHARGAKYPDDSSLVTFPYTQRSSYDIVTNANGAACLLFLPTFNKTNFIQCTIAGNVATPTTRAVDAPLGGVAGFRIVSWGFIFRRVSSNFTTSGLLRLRSKQTIDGQPFVAGYDAAAYTASESMDVSLIDATEVAIVGPHTSQMPQLFYNPDTVLTGGTATDWDSSGFSPISMLVSGAPASTTVASIEVVVHYEVQFDPDSSLALAATPPPKSNPLITGVAAEVTSATSSFFQRGVGMVANTVANAALGYLSRRLAPVSAMRTIMDVD